MFGGNMQPGRRNHKPFHDFVSNTRPGARLTKSETMTGRHDHPDWDNSKPGQPANPNLKTEKKPKAQGKDPEKFKKGSKKSRRRKMAMALM
jgi:hypothetical protein